MFLFVFLSSCIKLERIELEDKGFARNYTKTNKDIFFAFDFFEEIKTIFSNNHKVTETLKYEDGKFGLWYKKMNGSIEIQTIKKKKYPKNIFVMETNPSECDELITISINSRFGLSFDESESVKLKKGKTFCFWRISQGRNELATTLKNADEFASIEVFDSESISRKLHRKMIMKGSFLLKLKINEDIDENEFECLLDFKDYSQNYDNYISVTLLDNEKTKGKLILNTKASIKENDDDDVAAGLLGALMISMIAVIIIFAICIISVYKVFFASVRTDEGLLIQTKELMTESSTSSSDYDQPYLVERY